MRKFFALIFAVYFLHFGNSQAAISSWHENKNSGAKTKLIASFYQDVSGQKKLIAGIHFKIGSGWKVYGDDSSGIGMPPAIDFSGSKNVSENKIIWPKPEIGEEKIDDESIKFSYYKDEFILPIEITTQKIDDATNLTVQLDYGLCKEVCVPVSENFSLTIDDKIDQDALEEIQKFLPDKKIVTSSEKTPRNPTTAKTISMISAIFLAIFGGAILNIMPCVLPVLSIKLLSVINHSESPISRIRFAFLATIIGILSCFFGFAFLASLIKLTGNSLGWGLQFQNPIFLIFLIVILVLFLGNMLGIFEFTFEQALATILNKKITLGEEKRNIFIPNFLSGILAVLLATPCSAPFLGSAISFALTQSFLAIFLIFIFIGIGFAMPYIILSIAPKLVYLLPKPGGWMIQVKQLLSGLLAATVIWLIYILSDIVGTMPAFLAGALAITLLACLKVKFKLFKYFIITFIASLTFILPFGLQKHQKTQDHQLEGFWVPFNELEIQQHISQGEVVVVDITADWCLSCKFNKIRVLQNEEVIKKLTDDKIVAMRGDITKPNEEIMNYLHKNNRFAIPFNAVYGPNAPNGLLISELLTKSELLELIDKAK